jgi:hypothetical protein
VARLADCLNGKGFLVQPATGRVVGTSPSGVGFAVSLAGAIDDRGNPGGRRLAPVERRSIRACLH